MKYKKILGWIQIVLGAIIGLLSFIKLVSGNNWGVVKENLESSFDIFMFYQSIWIIIGILTIFVLIVLQGIINVKSKD